MAALLIQLFLAVLLSMGLGGLAAIKNRSFIGWTVASLFFTPILMFFALLFVGEYEEPSSEPRGGPSKK